MFLELPDVYKISFLLDNTHWFKHILLSIGHTKWRQLSLRYANRLSEKRNGTDGSITCWKIWKIQLLLIAEEPALPVACNNTRAAVLMSVTNWSHSRQVSRLLQLNSKEAHLFTRNSFIYSIAVHCLKKRDLMTQR